jgi:hypothetical protein
MEILKKVLKEVKLINKKQMYFLLGLVKGMIGAAGKKTFRNLGRYTGFEEHRFLKQMIKEVDFARINCEMIKEVSGRKCMAQDHVFIKKSGDKTPGLGPNWNGSAGRVEKGLELDVIAIVRLDNKREGFAISAEQTMPTEENKDDQEIENSSAVESKKKKKKQKQREKTKIDFAVEHVKKNKKHLVELGITHAVVDAFFAKKKYVQGVMPDIVHVISRLRIDTQLRILYRGQNKAGRGRPRKFEEGIKHFSDLSFENAIAVEEKDVVLTSTIAYCVALECQIKIVKVSPKKISKNSKHVYLFSTELTQDTLEIYECYSARFQIEFVFRDAKQFTGLEDCQSRNLKRLHYHFNASLLSLNVAKIEDILSQQLEQISHPFSMANYTRQYHVEIVINRFFSMLDLDPTLIKLNPNYQSFLNFGRIHH